MSRIEYFAKRGVQTVVLWFIIIVFLFFFFRLMPGDYTAMMLHSGVSPETAAAFKQKWGLNNPIYVQLWDYLVNLSQLDFGNSLSEGVPVWSLVQKRLFNSIILIAPAITAGYIIGSIWGAIIGNLDRSKLESYGITLAVFIGTLPIFYLGMLFIVVFGANIEWLPTSGIFSPDMTYEYRNAPWWRQYLTLDFAAHYILPFSVITIAYSSTPALLMRTSVDEVMGQGFAYYNRITGLPKWRRMAHLMRHASLPVLTNYPLSMSRAVGGMVLIEYVFSWPGVGSLLVSSVFARDFPVVQFIFILVATFILIGNFVVDILYGIVDPRVSVGE
jgi:peptide/nickel transport system permease protein